VRLLIDTQAVLWWINDDERLSTSAKRAIAKPASTRLLSMASAWELAIKSSLEKLKLPLPVGKFLETHLPINRIELLAPTFGDLTRVEALPFHHRDPFDRLIAAQALERDLTMVSSDPTFEKYGIDRIW